MSYIHAHYKHQMRDLYDSLFVFMYAYCGINYMRNIEICTDHLLICCILLLPVQMTEGQSNEEFLQYSFKMRDLYLDECLF